MRSANKQTFHWPIITQHHSLQRATDFLYHRVAALHNVSGVPRLAIHCKKPASVRTPLYVFNASRFFGQVHRAEEVGDDLLGRIKLGEQVRQLVFVRADEKRWSVGSVNGNAVEPVPEEVDGLRVAVNRVAAGV